MTLSIQEKNNIKNIIKSKLSKENEVQKIVLFGSFVNSDSPNDIDIAVFQDSNESYLPLSLKYRKLIREVSQLLPIDVLPIKMGSKGTFLDEIQRGEIIYEK